MTLHSAFYTLQEKARQSASRDDGFLNFGLLLLLAVVVVGFITWRFIKKKRQQLDQPEQNDPEPSIVTSLPSVTVIRASVASRYTDKLQLILQNLKMENRIEDFTMLDAGDDLSSLPRDIDEEDLVLIVLTNQLESQKERIESFVKPLKTRIAEIIVDNVAYDNAFITFPSDLRPICDRDDKDSVWNSIEQSLKELFPAQKKETSDRRQPINERLQAVENHPDYPDLLKEKPGSARLYRRYGCGIIFGLIFTVVALILSVVVPSAMDGFGPVGFVRILLLFFSVVGVGVTVWGAMKLTKLGSSKLRRFPALVVDKRISVTGGGQNSTATTWYYITLEFSDGERQELESDGKLYGTVTKDDAGVAYVKDRYLLDYRRLPV